MKIKQLISAIALLLLINITWASQIKNVNSKQIGTNIKISYEIFDANPLQQFDVFVFYSIDGKESSTVLKEVSGDVGSTVIGSGIKSILWNPIKELGSIHGKVKFKVVANPTTLLKTTKGKLDGMTVTTSNCRQSGKYITVDLIIDNQKESKMFDLYTNYIKAVDNNGLEFYALNYINGRDKVTTKRPINIKKGQKLKITVTFEAQGDSTSLFKSLELETKFPSNFMIIKNIPVQ
jgi:hypothetical protein